MEQACFKYFADNAIFLQNNFTAAIAYYHKVYYFCSSAGLQEPLEWQSKHDYISLNFTNALFFSHNKIHGEATEKMVSTILIVLFPWFSFSLTSPLSQTGVKAKTRRPILHRNVDSGPCWRKPPWYKQQFWFSPQRAALLGIGIFFSAVVCM